MATKVRNHTAISRDPISNAWPASVVATPVIIGFRVWRYGPTATSRDVGSHGASVPFPTRANRTIHQPASATPARMISTPNAYPANASAVSAGQRESADRIDDRIHCGTTTATTNGRSSTESTCRSVINMAARSGTRFRLRRLDDHGSADLRGWD